MKERLISDGRERQSSKPRPMYPPVPVIPPVQGMINLASEAKGIQKILLASVNGFIILGSFALGILSLVCLAVSIDWAYARTNSVLVCFLVGSVFLALDCLAFNAVYYLMAYKKLPHPTSSEIIDHDGL